MSEPTIDEMLEFIGQVRQAMVLTAPAELLEPTRDEAVRMTSAIRAILEQHREQIRYARMSIRRAEIVTIRAFVERIMSKYDNDELPLAERLFIRGDDDLYHALIAELAAMEKEAE